MKKAAVLMMEGFEESETITIVDILMRCGIEAKTFYFGEDPYVCSMQNMLIKGDLPFSDAIKDYDAIVIPGGRHAWGKLIEADGVLDMIRYFNDEHKLVAAMCSGTRVIKAADIIEGKTVTGYYGYEDVLTGAHFIKDVVACDDNLITSQGPATPYPFAFAIAEALGADTSVVRGRLLYKEAGGI
ncbi:MAG: DJ-1/PfpI family protein [Erysipelotrichaceae bacterium]|nr:DJ-1/PfpI family protein [Erysipelotrichaceae bacterium]